MHIVALILYSDYTLYLGVTYSQHNNDGVICLLSYDNDCTLGKMQYLIFCLPTAWD